MPAATGQRGLAQGPQHLRRGDPPDAVRFQNTLHGAFAGAYSLARRQHCGPQSEEPVGSEIIADLQGLRVIAPHDREDAMPENLDFTLIYHPPAHEPAVFSCDSPEEFCPFCTSGYGPLRSCERCSKYKVHRVEWLEDWDDPFVTREEAEDTCAECIEALREERRIQ